MVRPFQQFFGHIGLSEGLYLTLCAVNPIKRDSNWNCKPSWPWLNPLSWGLRYNIENTAVEYIKKTTHRQNSLGQCIQLNTYMTLHYH